jgi:hypothetical protein
LPAFDGKIIANKVYFNDQSKNKLTVLVGLRTSGDKTAEYKNQQLLTYNQEGRLVNKADLKFDYPRAILWSQGIKAAAETEGVSSYEGYLYVYSKVLGLGKKNNDPEPNNFNVVYSDADGNLIFNHNYKYGKAASHFKPNYAYTKDGAVYVFSKSVESGAAGYSISKFTREGCEYTKLYSSEELKAQSVGDAEGIQSIFQRDIDIQGHRTLANGDVVLFGQRKETIRTESFNYQTQTTVPGEYKHENYVFLQIAPAGELKAQYVVSRPANGGVAVPAAMEVVDIKNDVMYVLAKEAKQVLPAAGADYKNFVTSEANKTVLKNNANVASIPVIITLNTKERAVKSWRNPTKENIINLAIKADYLYNKEENSLLLLGKLEADNKNPLRIVLTKVQL